MRPLPGRNGNYTRTLRAILNKSWWRHPTRHQLYGHLPPITKTIPVRRTRHAGHFWRSKDELISYGHPHMAKQKQDDQLEHTYSSYVMIRDVALKTCQRWGMIGRSGERGPGIYVLAARHDDDDDLKPERLDLDSTGPNFTDTWRYWKRFFEGFLFSLENNPSPITENDKLTLLNESRDNIDICEHFSLQNLRKCHSPSG